jgi:energy-coupling factor transporter ATP-binding protein EcfA2
MRRPQFRCHDYAFELTGDPQIVSTLEALLADLTTSDAADPHTWDIETFKAHARVVVDGTDAGDWVLRELLPPNVISTLTVTVIAAHPTTLHLHAGAVVVDGHTVLVVAPSGSGKSTLTCALIAAGAEYRTDEVVAVDPDGRGVTTYPKPLSVKATGIDAVERLTGMTCPHRDRSWHFPASAIGSLAKGDDAPVTTIAFNSHQPSQPALVEPLHRATAVRLILADSQDAVVIGPESLVAAAGLTRSAHCLRATGGDAAEIARAVLDAHRTTVLPGVVESVPAPGGSASLARAADVQSVVVDGRAVLYTPEPHRVVELNESQTVWWLLLDGTPFDQIVDEVVRETGSAWSDVAAAGRTFVAGLRSLGVLRDP